MEGSSPHILVIDDQQAIRLMLKNGLAAKGFRVETARSGLEGLETIRREAFDAVLSDIYMPEGDGLEVVRQVRSLDSEIPIILMTAQGSVDLAVRAVSEGATDFIAKPFEVSAVADLLRRCLEARIEARTAEAGEDALAEELSASGLVGRSPEMVRVYKLIAHASRTDATVLITGESGTGKELVARAIHAFSSRSEKPFIAVNCAGLTDTLLESELFGHVKGSFTGATGDRAGLFEAADGGTILLDELASTSESLQASLLRVLQSGEVRRVGATQPRHVDVRVIGASNVPLDELAESGRFRGDLFYRLSVLTIELPPLRRRGDDIELLARHFLKRQSDSPYLTGDALEALRRYSFPGNVRELENAMTRASALASGGVITLDCLPSQIANCPRITDGTSESMIADHPTMDELQRRYLQVTLEEAGGDYGRAAEVLGLHRRTIQRLVERYGLPRDEEQ
ncbi:MAG: sigma-54-dependent Fis family transcriptional regulator [Acidobacteriota bacterium]|nr:MAG: sigma-54-dependent Fis family transcriptional regulator [Acidobacteriota bacterium]